MTPRPRRAAALVFAVSTIAAGLRAGTPPRLEGRWVSPAHRLEIRAGGVLVYDGATYRYQLQPGAILVQGPEGIDGYLYHLRGDRLVLSGGELGTMRFRRQPAEAVATQTATTSPRRPRRIDTSAGSGPRRLDTSAAPSAQSPPPAAPAQTPPRRPVRPPPAESGTPPAPGAALAARPYGISMTPAAGWQVRDTDEAVVFIHPKKPGRLFLAVLDEPVTPAEVEAASREGYRDLETQTDLRPVTPGSSQRVATGGGSGRYFRVRGRVHGVEIAGFAGLFTPPGGDPILALATAPPDKLAPVEGDFRRMLDGVRLHRPASEAAVSWDAALRGKRLVAMWSYYSPDPTGGGYSSASTRRVWDFCADGTYAYRYSGTNSFDTGVTDSGWGGGGGQSSRDETGRWRVLPRGDGEEATLILQPADGEAYRHRLNRRRTRGRSYRFKHFGDTRVLTSGAAHCP